MEKETIERPEFVTDECLEFLDDLRLSGVTNMFGASPYIEEEFPTVTHDEAVKIVSYWMRTFSERHKKD